MDSFVNVPDYGHGGWKVIVVAVLLIVMQLIMLCGRFASRRLQKVSLGADDYILTLSTIFTVGLCALAIACEFILNDFGGEMLIWSLQSRE